MKAKRSNSAGVIALLVIGAAGVYGIGVYIKQTPEAQTVQSPLRRPSGPTQEPSTPADHTDPVKDSSATILTPKSERGNLTFDSKTEDVPKGTKPIVFALNRFLENSHIAPSNARIVDVDVIDGMAHLDCTEAMEKSYGASDEAALLQGFMKTLAQFPELKKFELVISGRVVDSLGNVDLSKGLEITPTADSTTNTGA